MQSLGMSPANGVVNVRLYPYFMMFADCGILGPVWIVFCKETLHLSWTQIFISESVSFFVAAFFRLPLGAYSDKFGRKAALNLCMVVHLIGIGIAGVSWDWISWTAGTILWTIGIHGVFGNDSAFLYDTLKGLHREGEYKDLDGRAFSNRMFFMIVCCGLASLFTSLYPAVRGTGLRFCFLFHVVNGIVALILLAFMKEPAMTLPAEKILRIIKDGWQVGARDSVGLAIILFSVFLFAQISANLNVPYLRATGLPEYWYGIIWAWFHLVTAIICRTISIWEKLLGEKKLLAVIWIGRLISWALMVSFAPILGFLFLTTEQISRAFERPVIYHIINRRTPSACRGSVIAMLSFSQVLMKAVCSIFIGYMLDIWSFIGFSFFIAGGCLLFLLKKL